MNGQKISESVGYPDLGDGYISVYKCENSLSGTVRFVHFIICTSILKRDEKGAPELLVLQDLGGNQSCSLVATFSLHE